MTNQQQAVFSYIEPTMVDIIWPGIKHMIQVAIDESNGEFTLEGIKDDLESKKLLAAVVTLDNKALACVVFDKRTFDSGKKVINIMTAGGELLELWVDDVLRKAEQLAIQEQCDEVYIIGRKGWLRTLKGKGYNHVHTVVSKKIGDA